MINILHISHYPTLQMGGQQSMFALIKNLDKHNFNSYVLLPSEGELSNVLEEAGYKCFFLPLCSLKAKNIFRTLSNIIKLHCIIKRDKIDIIHCDSERDAFISIFAKKHTNAKLIYHLRLTRKNNLDKAIIKNSDHLIGISEGTRQRVEKEYQSKLSIIFNGVDVSKFVPVDDEERIKLKQELSFPDKDYNILFVGQIKYGKGILDLIEAAKILNDKGCNFSVSLVGKFENNEFETLVKNKIKDYNLTHIFYFWGQRDNIYRFMQAADVLVLPSHEGVEGMGRVIFEAMACGIPAVASDISGVREAVPKGTGILVLEKNPTELANALIEINKTGSKNYVEKCRQNALTNFDIKEHAKKVEKVYNHLLNKE